MGDEMGMIDEAKKRRDMSLAALGRAIFPGVSMQSMADEERENEDKNIIGSLIKASAACERELVLAEVLPELDRLRERIGELEILIIEGLCNRCLGFGVSNARIEVVGHASGKCQHCDGHGTGKAQLSFHVKHGKSDST